MKRFITLIAILLTLSSVLFAQRTRNPQVEKQYSSRHNIFEVLCYQEETYVLVECAASRFSDSSFSISSRTTLSNANKSVNLTIVEWGLYDADSETFLKRTFDQSCTVDMGKSSIYYMKFGAIPTGIETIFVSENVADGFFWHRIQIKNAAKIEEIEGSRRADTGSSSTPQATDDEDTWLGSASGFFLSRQGYIATNYHVVDGVNKMQVEYYHEGRKHTYSAEVVTSDKANDMAIIRINDEKFTGINPIPYKLSLKAKDVGSDVFTLGYPLSFIMGEEIKYTRGEISAKTGFQGDVRTYQISVPITNGNSGGPLFDYEGNIIGITSSGLRKDLADNVNYAIKAIYLQTLVESTQDNIVLPVGQDLTGKTKPELIKILQEFVVLIKVK